MIVVGKKCSELYVTQITSLGLTLRKDLGQGKETSGNMNMIKAQIHEKRQYFQVTCSSVLLDFQCKGGQERGLNKQK